MENNRNKTKIKISHRNEILIYVRNRRKMNRKITRLYITTDVANFQKNNESNKTFFVKVHSEFAVKSFPQTFNLKIFYCV